MAQTFVSTIIHVTPKVEDLLHAALLKCEVNGCTSVFKNSGNLRMHLKKHHKLPTTQVKDESEKLFFCPQLDCIYYDSPQNRKSFKCLKLLKQHFQKVHAAKIFGCTKCDKKFGTDSMRESHEKNCGKAYICGECGWTYDSSEALLTHARRRGHQIKVKNGVEKVAIPRLEKVAIPRLEKVAIPRLEKVAIPKLENVPIVKLEPVEKVEMKFFIEGPKDIQTQTEVNTLIHIPKQIPSIALPPKKRRKIVLDPEINPFQETPLCNIETPLCDIETQTELNMISGHSDPMLYSNMHTQTCDEFLSELGLADIQTQTNWPALDDDDDPKHQNNQFSSCAHDELMVSTETQTSFTQCLLDSCNEENSLTGNITQHTQTCDTLLEGLFGGQDNDFIGSFQSTHTQT